MKKYISLLLAVLVLCFCISLPVFADSSGSELPRLMDDADLLTDSEESVLLAELDEISERQECDVIVVTIETEGNDDTTVTEYADDFYDYWGYGIGEDKSGILLFVDMTQRNWAISTCGYGITAFTDAGQEYMTEQFVPYLTDDDYSGAFDQYATLCDSFLTQARTGSPYDSDNLPKTPLSYIWIIISIIAGALIALIITSIMKGKMKTVRKQPDAECYVKDGSMDITDSRDMFLYQMVNKVAKPKDDDSSGSSTHTSSSGATHGGSSGSF